MPYESTGGRSPAPVSKVDSARETTKSCLQHLAEQLESGASAQLDAYLAAMGRFHAYSFNNIMLILAQRSGATRVAGFHTWRSLGRTVKRGEKGIAIFAPMRIAPKRIESEQETDEDSLESKPTPVMRFRIVYVFDVSQTEGEALPEPPRVGGDPGPWLERLEQAVTNTGITLDESSALHGALGVSKGGMIVIKSGLPAAERFSVLVHEWAHEQLHHVESGERPDKTVRELEAEAVAFVVSRAIGLDTGTASADYIRLYNGDAAALAASLDRIQRTANGIIEALSSDQAERSHPRRTATQYARSRMR